MTAKNAEATGCCNEFHWETHNRPPVFTRIWWALSNGDTNNEANNVFYIIWDWSQSIGKDPGIYCLWKYIYLDKKENVNNSNIGMFDMHRWFVS